MKIKSNTKLDLITLGRAGVDFNPIEDDCTFGEAKTYLKSVGGSPANIAAGFAVLGGKAGFIGRVSGDTIGQYVIDELSRLGVNTDGIIKDKNAVNCLAITERIKPTFSKGYLYRDNVADMNLCIDDISEEYIKESKILLITGTALSASPSKEAVYKAVELAKKNDVLVALDFDFRLAAWESEEVASVEFNNIASKCDILIGNREEFNVVEVTTLKGNSSDEVTSKYWLDRDVQMVVIKKGELGSTVYNKDGSIITRGIFKTDIKKTYGSGDAYAAGLMYGIIYGMSVEDSIDLGSGCAALVLQQITCSSASPTMQQVKDFISNYK